MLREIAPWNSVFLWKMKRTVARSWNSHWEQKRTRTKSQLRQRRLWLSSWRELWMLYRYWTLGGHAVTHLSSYLPGGHRFESRWSPNFFRLLLQTGRDGTSNAMFDELAERSLISESLDRDKTYVCKASHNYPLPNSSFQLLKLKIYCDDHSSLSSTTAVHVWIVSYILYIKNRVCCFP